MNDATLAGLHLVADESLRRHERGRVLFGGSPLRLVRVSERGAELVDRLLDGEPVPQGAGAQRLVRRLLDGNLLQPRPDTSPFGPLDVTVVIPVRGALDPALLDAIGIVARIVVVDDASDLPVAIKGPTVHGVQVEVVRHPDNRGPAAARNTGLTLVDSPVVAFIDADCVPRPGWLEPLLAQFTDPEVAACAPRIVAADPVGPVGHRLLERFERVEAALDRGPTRGRVRARTRTAYVPSAALVARVGTLRSIGGFDESLTTGEDVDLVWRLDEADHTVRYEPSATVGHRHRVRPWAWARRRFDYGASAGPLARRHPGALVPVEASGWSYATWVLLATGHPFAAAAMVGATIGQLHSRLESLEHPLPVIVPLTLRGHLAAGRLLATALVRPWWPLTALALAFVPSRRLRVTLLGALLAPPLIDWFRRRPPIPPHAYVALRLLDDVAYSSGVWVGSVRARTIDPLRPEFTAWPKPSRYSRWRDQARASD